MTINNISVYNRLLNTLKAKTSESSSTTTSKTGSTEASGNVTGTSTGTTGTETSGLSYIDTLALGNVDEDNYLNYGQLAKYNMPTLSDYMSDSEDSSDSDGMDLTSILGDSGSSDSESSTMFDGLIKSTSSANDQAIQKAIEKMSKSDSAKDPEFLKKLEAIKAEIKNETK